MTGSNCYGYYKVGQCSPQNPQGHMIYNRDFLIQFASRCKERPKVCCGTEEIMLPNPRHPDSYIKTNGPSKSLPVESFKTSQPKVINISLPTTVNLHRTHKAWKPAKRKGQTTKVYTCAATYRAVMAFLNKLTPQKFEPLVEKLQGLKITTEECLKGTVDRIHEKAIDEHNFSVMYAKLCQRMNSLCVPTAENPAKDITFKICLINRCQQQFEKKGDSPDIAQKRREIEASSEAKRKQLEEDLMIIQNKTKRHQLGNVKLIGELFKLKIITPPIMHSVVKDLLRSGQEIDLECLCKLLTTAGKDFDPPINQTQMNDYFGRLKNIMKKKKASSRICFLIQNLIDLRVNKWVPRHDNNPKTINEIHQEAQKEEKDRQDLLAILEKEPVLQPSQRRRQKRKEEGSIGNVDWQPSWKNRISKEKLCLPRVSTDDMKFGPMGQVHGIRADWSKGSSGGRSSTSNAESNQHPNININRSQRGNHNAVKYRGKIEKVQVPTPTFDGANRYSKFGPSTDNDKSKYKTGARSRSSLRQSVPNSFFVKECRDAHQGSDWGPKKKSPVSHDPRPSEDNSYSKCRRRQSLMHVETHQLEYTSEDKNKCSIAHKSFRATKSDLPNYDSARSKSDPEFRCNDNRIGQSSNWRNLDGSNRSHSESNLSVNKDRIRDNPYMGGCRSTQASLLRELTSEEIEQKTTSLMEEYLQVKDIKEAVFCVVVLNTPKRLHLVVYHILLHSLEKTKQAREATGKLLYALSVEQRIITKDQYLSGLKRILDCVEDLEVDVPHVYEYLAQMVAPMVTADGCIVSLSDLLFCAYRQLPTNKGQRLVVCILHEVADKTTRDSLRQLWHRSYLNWQDFLQQNQNIDDFLINNRLEFLK